MAPNSIQRVTSHKMFLEQAYLEAKKARSKDEVPVGAVVVHKGKIIARGHNLREKKQSVLGHAELIALKKASQRLGSWRLVDCDVYITLEPCAMCAAALQQARVRAVFYGARDLKTGAMSLRLRIHNNRRLNHQYKARFIHDPKCGKILSDFFCQKRKVKLS